MLSQFIRAYMRPEHTQAAPSLGYSLQRQAQEVKR